MMDSSTEIPLCDNEPIHIPGSIQPHGIMLVAARRGMLIWQVAGDVESWLGLDDWQGAPLAALLGRDLAAQVAALSASSRLNDGQTDVAYIGQLRTTTGALMDVSAHSAGLAAAPDAARDMVVVELEPAADDPITAALLLDRLDAATAEFQRAGTLEALCRSAAVAFRRLTGFDRVMIYRFLDDDAGRVLAEDKAPDLRSFMNHHFPASDIPRQARALYVRNLVRVIPDIHYAAAPLRPPAPGRPLDMTDSSLRSVSPVHLQYLFNMGVRASASFSIVKDGALWGLVACHNEEAQRIPFEIRVACRTLAGALSREITGKSQAEDYRQRLRLRSFEDDVIRVLSREGSLDAALVNHLTDIRRVMATDGVAVLRGRELVTGGACPPEPELRALAEWALAQSGDPIQCTDRLPEIYAPAQHFAATASGLLAMVLSPEEPWVVLWLRAEQIETLNWAGNPHKGHDLSADEMLTPRASFDLWAETVRGRSRRWTGPELDGAKRLRNALLDVRQNRRMVELNRQLTAILQDKDLLLQQKEFLIGEVNHRVQNSLQLVASFLALQSRHSDSADVHAALNEARRRLNAVGLVHRRLYSGDQIEMIDGARYLEELCQDAAASMGPEWQSQLSLDLAPVMISTDRAVTLGLVVTELLINVNKYAYGGQPGPIDIRLTEDRDRFQLALADRGVGRQTTRHGFGSRMMTALVQQLGGDLAYEDNRPGLRAVLSATTGSALRPA